jgi:3-deoxy-D-manno-octulosonic-acid transferase
VVQVADRQAFAVELGALLRDGARRQALGARARAVIADNQGATARTLDLVADLLGPAPAAPAAPARG